jgi:branched-chain amino acid transport system substrate-binding protein
LKLKRFALLLCVVALVAAACGGDDKNDDATQSSTDSTAASSGTDSGTCKLDKPLKIVGFAETTGEGAQAVPYYANGWELGVQKVNDEGGICGQDVDFERLPINPTDNAQAKNQFLGGVDKHPDVMMGFPNSATVVALAPDILRAATPFIYFSSPPNAFLGAPQTVGNKYGFLIRPRTTGTTGAQVDYLIKELGKKKIGLVCVNQTFGQQGCEAAKAAIAAAGGTVVDTETHEVTDTNLTSKVLGLKNKGVEGIVAFTFPNTGVVLFNQMADNGLNVPIMTGAIAGLATNTKSVSAEGVKNLYGMDDCAPAVEPQAKDFATAYKAKFGTNPSYSAAQAYDSLSIIKQAVEKAGSADKEAVAEAMKSIDYEGTCVHYKSDEGNGLSQSAVLETFAADGTPTVVKTVEITK